MFFDYVMPWQVLQHPAQQRHAVCLATCSAWSRGRVQPDHRRRLRALISLSLRAARQYVLVCSSYTGKGGKSARIAHVFNRVGTRLVRDLN